MADQPRRGRRFATTKVEVEGRESTTIVELPSLEPAPWTEDTVLSIVGCRVPRADSLEKVTGRAEYTTDVVRTAMTHAVLVRSPVAAGRVLELDVSPALALPGVRGALLLDDVPGVELDGLQLFDRTIHYAGQPLAALAADTEEIATRALAAIRLRIEAAPPITTPEQALLPSARRLRPKGNMWRGRPRLYTRGNAAQALASAPTTITREYRTPVALHSALEPHSAAAEWVGHQLTLWESTQGIFNTRADLAKALAVPLSHVRVITNYMGGGFGAKNGASHATFTAAFLSRKIRRPVRCALDREGEQTDAGNRPSTRQRVTLAADEHGTLLAIQLDATVPLGMGGWEAGLARIYQEMYECPNVSTSETFVYTNTAPMASFRAPGHVEGAFGLECAMDALAKELRLDPLELRRHNHAPADQVKQRGYSDKRLLQCYDLGAAKFGWAARRARAREESRSTRRRGIGMASLTWGAGGGPPAYATVRLNRDGSVDVLVGTQDLGTGSRTVFAQIAAEQLGARYADVRTVLGDTERLPYAPNSWGSMTTASVGPAVRVAAEEARLALVEAAAAILDVPVDDLLTADSTVHTASGDRSITFAEVCEELGDVMLSGHGSRGPNPDGVTVSAFAAQFAEVEVDVETGVVRVLRFVAAHDSGRIINPTLAESQLEGGIIQGLGYALFEERVLDARTGRTMNPTLHDYKIPTIADLPRIEAMFVRGSDVTANHSGAKGLAEPPIIGVAPAVANAVADALGVAVDEIPLTPWRVLGSMKRKA